MESQTAAATTKTTKAVVVLLAVARALVVSIASASATNNPIGIVGMPMQERKSGADPIQAILLVFLIISIPTIHIISEYLITLGVYVEVNEHLRGNVTTKS